MSDNCTGGQRPGFYGKLNELANFFFQNLFVPHASVFSGFAPDDRGQQVSDMIFFRGS
jgi:hypothetical protein